MKNKNFWNNKKILVTGGNGFVGSHVVSLLTSLKKVDPSNIIVPSSKTCDLRIYQDAEKVMQGVDIVLHLAADVGGIAYSSSHPATQLRNCLLIDANVFEAATVAKVQKLVCVSSAVAYPEKASSPLQEENIFDGLPANGGYGYGIAKRLAVVLAKAYHEEKKLNTAVILSANAYGPQDDFNLENGHVIPSLIIKCLTQKTLSVWGDGSQIRDFIYVKDLARAILLVAESDTNHEPINIGSGEKYSVKNLVEAITALTNFPGEVVYDTTKPTGQKERVLNSAKAKEKIQFSPEYSLEKGIAETIGWYKNHQQHNTK